MKFRLLSFYRLIIPKKLRDLRYNNVVIRKRHRKKVLLEWEDNGRPSPPPHYVKQDIVKEFKNDKKVVILNGDSGVVLKEVVPGLNNPAIFWLDGHYSAGVTARGEKDCPIKAEIDAIFKDNRFEHVLLIDDARCFTGSDDYPTLEELKNYIKAKNNRYNIEVKNDVICCFT